MPIYQPSSPVYGRDYRRYDWINALGKGFDLYGDYRTIKMNEARAKRDEEYRKRQEERADQRLLMEEKRLQAYIKSLNEQASRRSSGGGPVFNLGEYIDNISSSTFNPSQSTQTLSPDFHSDYVDNASPPVKGSSVTRGSVPFNQFTSSSNNIAGNFVPWQKEYIDSLNVSFGVPKDVLINANRYLDNKLKIGQLYDNATERREAAIKSGRDDERFHWEKELKNLEIAAAQNEAQEERNQLQREYQERQEAEKQKNLIKYYKDVAGGFYQFPREMGRDLMSLDVRSPTEAEKGYARTQLIRHKEADKLGDLEKKQLGFGVADAVTGKVTWVGDPYNNLTYAQNLKRTQEWIAPMMRGIAEEANDKTDDGLIIPSITENEEERIINNVVLASIQIAKTTGKNVEDIVRLILNDKKLYSNSEHKLDKSGDDEHYYDYIPKGHDEIITAFDQKYKHSTDITRTPITTQREAPVSLDSIALVMSNGRNITYRELKEEAIYQSHRQKREVSMEEVKKQLQAQDGINQNTILQSNNLPNRLPSGS